MGRPAGVVRVEVVVLVPVPALRRTVEEREGAVVVVAVVAGRVRVEVTGRGRLGRPVVVMGGGAMVVMGVEVAKGAVVVGAVPVPATGGSVNASRASSTLTGKDRLKSSMSRSNWARSTGRVSSATMSVMVLISWAGGGVVGAPTPAGERVGVSMRSDNSVRCLPSLCRR